MKNNILIYCESLVCDGMQVVVRKATGYERLFLDMIGGRGKVPELITNECNEILPVILKKLRKYDSLFSDSLFWSQFVARYNLEGAVDETYEYCYEENNDTEKQENDDVEVESAILSAMMERLKKQDVMDVLFNGIFHDFPERNEIDKESEWYLLWDDYYEDSLNEKDCFIQLVSDEVLNSIPVVDDPIWGEFRETEFEKIYNLAVMESNECVLSELDWLRGLIEDGCEESFKPMVEGEEIGQLFELVGIPYEHLTNEEQTPILERFMELVQEFPANEQYVIAKHFGINPMNLSNLREKIDGDYFISVAEFNATLGRVRRKIKFPSRRKYIMGIVDK